MEEEGKEEGATTEEATSKEREECCDKRRKVRKKTKRRFGTKKLRRFSKLRWNDRARDKMTWQNIRRSRRADKVTTRK